MNPPNAVSIVGQPWAIEVVPNVRDHPLVTENDLGRAQIREQRLVICAGQSFHQERDTVLHELLHAVALTMGIDDAVGEDQVTILAPVLLDALRSNPALVAYLTEAPA